MRQSKVAASECGGEVFPWRLLLLGLGLTNPAAAGTASTNTIRMPDDVFTHQQSHCPTLAVVENAALCPIGRGILELDLSSGTVAYSVPNGHTIRAIVPAPANLLTTALSGTVVASVSNDEDHSYFVEDYLTGERVADVERHRSLRRAPDINGDGRVDFVTDYQVVLTHQAGAEVMPVPGLEEGRDYFVAYPLGDVTGDGLGDLLAGYHSTSPAFIIQYYPQFWSSALGLYPGTPDGYATTPLWVVDTPMPMLDAVAVQLDADPELEIMGLGNGLVNRPANQVELAITIDVVQGTPVVDSFDVHLGWFPEHSKLVNIGDLDLDGLDDVLMTSWDFTTEEHMKLLGSSTGYDPDAPLARFGGTTDYLEDGTFDVFDIDSDGHVDLIMGHAYAFELFYGPLYEAPEPVATGDTGTPAPTADTGSTAATGSTGTTAHTGTAATIPTGTEPTPVDTGMTPPTSGGTGKPPSSCGCQAPAPAGGWLGVLLLPAVLRRRRASLLHNRPALAPSREDRPQRASSPTLSVDTMAP